MKNISEAIKDFLYDSIDYIFIIGIIGAVVFVISWRLDLLFASDTLDLPTDNNPVVVETGDNYNNIDEPSEDVSTTDNEDTQESNEDIEDTGEKDIIDNNEQNMDLGDENVEGPANDTIVNISIPPGSLPSRIGSILEEKGLITSKGEFVQKAQDMNLDTKLKSGDFEIIAGSSLEEIIKIIAK